MAVKFVLGREVARPDITPLSSSVMDHATVVENDHFGLNDNAGLWPSYNCLDTTVPTPMCPDPLLDTLGTPKVFVFAEWQPAIDFAMYGGVQCSNIGLDVADMKSEVARVFAANEGKGVEQALLYNRFVIGDDSSDMPATWAAPTDLTPVTAVSLVVALALLEGHSAAVYAGQPTIHMPRAAATVLSSNGLIEWKDNKAFTKSGAKVAIGGGYDDPAMLASGLWTMYATGEVYIERSEEITVHQYVVPGDGSRAAGGTNALTDNTSLALAERMFRVAVDCFVVKCTGTVTPIAGTGFGN